MKVSKFLHPHILFFSVFLFTQTIFAADKTVVDIETNYGTMTVELYPDKAPITVENFLRYVDANYYSDVIFHRVISGFVIQAGAVEEDLIIKPTFDAIENEADNGLSNERGSIAMARISSPHSATSQFYFNLQDNPGLNYSSSTTSGWGYAVFGKMIQGLEVMDAIGAVATATVDNIPNFPLSTVKILAARRRQAQLSFNQPQSEYQAGDILTLNLFENDIVRSEELDLWAGFTMPDGSFRYFTGNSKNPLSTSPTALQTRVAVTQTQHPVYTLSIPSGLTGNYTIYGLFNSLGADLNQLSQTLRSNIATTQIIIK